MKLYKFDYKGTIGNNVITVPTDSQFLIGIGNGDASSTAQLFDGTTEILPEDDKIGEYTCFRMETQGTQFRKPYKAVINGNNFENKDLWVLTFDDVDYQGYTSIGLGLPENINPEDLNYVDGQAPVLTSFQAYVYGYTRESGFHYIKTITLTWNASKSAYEIPEDFGNEIVKYIQFADCTESYIYFGYGWETATGGDDEYDAKTSVGVPNPYTQNIDLYIICKKMSVAYRDETGLTSTEAVQAVKDSGEFVGKDNLGNYEAVGSLYINSGNGKVGSLYLTTGDPDYVAPLALEVDAENEEISAYGVINGEEGLTIRNTILGDPEIESFIDGDEQVYTRQEITVKINGVEKNIVVLAHLLS